MVALTAFTSELSLTADGVPSPLAEHYVRNAAIAFCNATQYIVEELPPIDVAAEDDSIPLTLAAGEEVVAVTLAYFDGSPLAPISESQLQRDVGAWKTRVGTPTHYISTDNVVRLYPLPGSDGELIVTVAKRPTRTATSIDDRLNAEWREAMLSGALSTILLIPNKTFSSPDMAAVHRAIFNDWIVSAQAKAFKRSNYAPLRVETA